MPKSIGNLARFDSISALPALAIAGAIGCGRRLDLKSNRHPACWHTFQHGLPKRQVAGSTGLSGTIQNSRRLAPQG